MAYKISPAKQMLLNSMERDKFIIENDIKLKKQRLLEIKEEIKSIKKDN